MGLIAEHPAQAGQCGSQVENPGSSGHSPEVDEMKYSEENQTFFDKAFEGYEVPINIKKLAMRLCRSYGIEGTCDPMYISNVIAFELGLGDGSGNFIKIGIAEGE
jgi:hypothetical protein